MFAEATCMVCVAENNLQNNKWVSAQPMKVTYIEKIPHFITHHETDIVVPFKLFLISSKQMA